MIIKSIKTEQAYTINPSMGIATRYHYTAVQEGIEFSGTIEYYKELSVKDLYDFIHDNIEREYTHETKDLILLRKLNEYARSVNI